MGLDLPQVKRTETLFSVMIRKGEVDQDLKFVGIQVVTYDNFRSEYEANGRNIDGLYISYERLLKKYTHRREGINNLDRGDYLCNIFQLNGDCEYDTYYVGLWNI